jgi:hypothetical protein
VKSKFDTRLVLTPERCSISVVRRFADYATATHAADPTSIKLVARVVQAGRLRVCAFSMVTGNDVNGVPQA